jgi:adenosylcobinamide-GDP ribazoletransferase
MRRDALRLSITLLSVLPAAGRRPETAGSPAENTEKEAEPGLFGGTGRLPGQSGFPGRPGQPVGPGGDAGPPWEVAGPPPGAAAPGDGASSPGLAAPDRETAGEAMAWAPVVGLLLGVIAAAVLYVSGHLLHTGSLVAAALSVGSLAVLTRALHLDGLADLTDGLGSRKPAADALDIMRRSDIGPFGVVAVALTLLLQVAGLTQADAAGRGPAAVIVAVVTGRLAITWACRQGVPAARPEGLGALVAGTLPPVVPALITAAVLAVTIGGIYLAAGVAAVPVEWILPVAETAGLLAALALARHAVRRLGGVTGDVLGALVETATAACLVVTAMS